MKSNHPVVLLIVGLLCLLFISSCASSQQSSSIINDPDAPHWILTDESDDITTYGVGSAKLSNLQSSIIAAESNARVDILNRYYAKVETIMESYVSGLRTNEKSTSLSTIEQMTTTSSSGIISMAKRTNTYVQDNGTVWVRIAVPTATLKNNALESFEAAATSRSQYDDLAPLVDEIF